MLANQARTLARTYVGGDVIAGKYELDALLGQGGMGAVWRARNIALDAPVAIKLLKAEGDRSALRDRLIIEARATAKISHPAIVKVFDVGQTESQEPFIVMELLHGTSLGSLLREQTRLPPTTALQMLLPIAEALAVAHRKGLVHRDVKPDNIFLVHHEGRVQPKLVDFGIVKVAEEERDLGLTRAGMIMGSPDYLSPEQAKGLIDIDHQSDVWAFCVVLFEAIAGRVPFDAANCNALLRQIVDDRPPALHEVVPVDEQLSAIVARGLAKQRHERHHSMTDLGRALAQWLYDQGVTQDICETSLDTKWLHRDECEAHEASDNVWLPEARSGVRLVLDLEPTLARPGVDGPAKSLPHGQRRRLLRVLGVTALLVGAAALVPIWYAWSSISHAAIAVRIGTTAESPIATASQEPPAETISLEQLPLEMEPEPGVGSGSPSPARALTSGSQRPRSVRAAARKPRPQSDLLRPY
jgi:serine/threonine protein kinase